MKRLILLLVLLGAAPARAITLSQIQSDCRVLIKDSGSSRQRFSDSTLLRFANEGQKDLTQFTRGIRKTVNFELAAGTTYYAAPTDFLFALRVTRDYVLLPEKSPESLDKMQQWEQVSGLPINYFIRFTSRTLVGFYPWPGDSTSTGTIRMDYVAQVRDLASSTDQPFNAITELQPFGYLLSLYCGYRASLIDGQMTLSQAYYAEYKRGLEMMSTDATSRPAYKPPAMGGDINPNSR